MWLIVLVLIILLLCNNKETFDLDVVKQKKEYILVTRYHENIQSLLIDFKKNLDSEIIILVDDEIELEKLKKLNIKGEILTETNPLLISQYFIKKFNKSVLYVDKNIEVLNKNINNDITKYINDNSVDIVFRCNSDEFSNTCENNVSDSFMLMKPNINIELTENNKLNDYLKNNSHLKWTIFNSYYYPNRDRYYNNIRSVYYNKLPYIRNKELL